MRIFLAMAVAFSLSGCADSDFVDHPITSLFGSDDAQPAQAAPVQPAQTAQAPASAQPRAASDHCRKLARQRAGDAAYAGEDMETQQSVYDRTYADCTAWDTKHAS